MNTLSRAALGFGSFVALAAGFVGCGITPQENVGSGGSDITSCASGPTVRGVDVSHYDGSINWGTVSSAGISFGFAKATEGTNLVDSKFAANWAGMSSAGVVRGAYHFFHPGTDAVAQANFVVNTVGPLGAGDLGIVCDLETTDGLSESQIVARAVTFLDTVTRLTGKTAILYASPGFLSSFGGLGAYPLWIANYGVACPKLPSAWSGWQFWQSSDTGSVSGIPSAVDLNVYNGTLAELVAFAGGGGGGRGTGSGSGSGTGSGGATSCNVSGEAGTCIDTSACAAQGGTSTSGHCPGARNIECCTGVGSSSGNGGGSSTGSGSGSSSGGTGSGTACSTDGDCNTGSDGSGQICTGGVCVAGCNADWECPGNTTCHSGSCQ